MAQPTHYMCIGHPLLWGHDDEVVDVAYRQQHLGAQQATLVCLEEVLHPFESLVGRTILVLIHHPSELAADAFASALAAMPSEDCLPA